MLGRRDQNALPHQAGGVAHLGDIAAVGWNFEVVQVRAPEHDPGTSRCGNKPHRDRCAGMEANTAELQRGINGAFDLCFRTQKVARELVRQVEAYRSGTRPNCGNFATVTL